jgi:hypothetical protein
MGWAIGYDDNWNRDIGYGVPCKCDHPDCDKDIDRGLAYVCGGEPYGGDRGCGLFFCSSHLSYNGRGVQLCPKCIKRNKPYKPKPDTRYWMRFKMKHPSWKLWRSEHPREVAEIREILYGVKQESTHT